MNWWDLFVWGYATDIAEEDLDEEELVVDVTISVEVDGSHL
jgi:hypothetical protein